ncbi:DesA family fatty acid desaturase [Pigmentiphaga litoralis]|uniref:Stearoyl-CoA desaturase (Delta-9 desaturase) n=1 Tax=Pigmentiphaga litoralis TaxID=516702 RepID=A0A7Y9J0G6_9BURK|nr:fatty acid desaturase [Pigmentiphaga litoralis]NYE26797.1 stearoyl-CoA desaturase (delta-9 desaturase) [Pigmentiphaga litoralis]NYE85793.1 stearoyl-CoA desaturase (delta-9 desaturase) [Pigmentiphaga litoralis]
MDWLLSFLSNGLLDAAWWQILVFALVVTHVTILSVTIYLHRCQAHRGLDLHPAVAHFFRFWLWLTTGMVTKEWVAIHRKHHARCERDGDPHSPMVFGIGKVFFEGAELYRAESKVDETMAKFGHGTPNDWVERNLYSRFQWQGAGLMMIIDVLLFGAIGLTVWAVQMIWIPFWAAGVVNGIGHFWGYRNYASPDASRNVSPWGFIIGGEELHNNHHAYASSAKFSSKWYEIDVGWGWIRAFEILGLAKVKKVAPKLRLNETKPAIDQETLQAVITHRYEIMARYADLLKHAAHDEIQRLKSSKAATAAWHPLKRTRSFLHLADDESLPPAHRTEVASVLAEHHSLATLVQMRRELSSIWERSTASSEQLLKDLQDWCNRAQQSGIARLEEFSARLRSYAA